MFGIIIWYDKDDESDTIGIKCKKINKVIGDDIQNKPFKKVISTFFVDLFLACLN